MKKSRREALIISGLAAGGLGGIILGYDTLTTEDPDDTDKPEDPPEPDDFEVATNLEDGGEFKEVETVTELHVDFLDRDWVDRFTEEDVIGNVDLSDDPAYYDQSLSVGIPEGSSYGTSLHYLFPEESPSEPEELWASYYIYLPESFDVTDDVGKLPGPAGTYGNAGWGGRQSDGTNGWSARMGFGEGNSNEVGLNYYVYHADMDSDYGDLFNWDISLTKGHWHRIDQYIRLNDPEKSDGILMGWVDGEKAYNRRNLRFRETPELKIEDYWFTVYWGGAYVSPADNSILFDHLTIRKSN